MIAIIDYGLGNVQAFANVYTRLNIPFIIANKSDDIEIAHKIILPGVGAFDYAMTLLDQSGMLDMLNERVQKFHVPVLGVCVGMQMMADSSDEGKLPGLGWIKGHVKKFDSSLIQQSMNIPHMGWNNIHPCDHSSVLMEELDSSSRFYFLHSFYFDCETNTDSILATTNYVHDFTCAVFHKNIYGVQFHPEKSHHWGEKILENFARL